MDDKGNILKQAKQDVFNALEGILKFYTLKGASYSALKKYYKKKKNFEEILEDIRNKSINLFDDENQYKKFVKEVLMDMLDDRIAHEKDKKKLKKFESFTNENKVEYCKNCNDILVYRDRAWRCIRCGEIDKKDTKLNNIDDINKWLEEQKKKRENGD